MTDFADETYLEAAATIRANTAPGFGEYQAKTTRVIPLFELKPTG